MIQKNKVVSIQLNKYMINLYPIDRLKARKKMFKEKNIDFYCDEAYLEKIGFAELLIEI